MKDITFIDQLDENEMFYTSYIWLSNMSSLTGSNDNDRMRLFIIFEQYVNLLFHTLR